MTKQEMQNLKRGDIVMGKCSGDSYVIDVTAKEYAIGMRTAHITQPDEWVLIVRKDRPTTS